jgi:hypothetical protein
MTWHIIPVNDLEEHEETTTCKCEPEVHHINNNMVIIHSAFDGREGLEQVEEILKNLK